MTAYLVAARFDSHILKQENGCWEWQACKRKGYGRFKYKGTMIEAHRFAYEQVKGEIPRGLQLDHLCRNHGCVNPSHLEIVTNQENCRRGNTGLHNAVKTHCPQGHPYDILNTYFYHNKNGVTLRSCRVCHAIAELNRRKLCAQ